MLFFVPQIAELSTEKSLNVLEKVDANVIDMKHSMLQQTPLNPTSLFDMLMDTTKKRCVEGGGRREEEGEARAERRSRRRG